MQKGICINCNVMTICTPVSCHVGAFFVKHLDLQPHDECTDRLTYNCFLPSCVTSSNSS